MRTIILLCILFSYPISLYSRDVTVAVFDNAPPVSDLDPEGNPSGFFPELVSRMLEDLGHTPKLIPYNSFSEAYSAAAGGDVMLMTALLKNPQRELDFTFIGEPLMISWSQVYTLDDSHVDSIFDLEGRKIALMEGDQNAENFIELMDSFGLNFESEWTETFSHCIQAVDAGDAAALVAFSTFHLSHPELIPTSIVFSPSEAYVATADSAAITLINEMNSLAITLKSNRDSYYYEILDRWFLYPGRTEIPDWLKLLLIFSGFAISASIMFLLVFRSLYNKARVRLYETEAKYKIIADFTYDWEYWVDPAGSMIHCSPSCIRVSGYPAADFISGKIRIQDIVLDEDLDIWLDHLHSHDPENPRGSVDTVNFRIRDKGGTLHWIEHVCIPVEGPGGTFLGYRGTNRDVTDRTEAQQKALESVRLKTRFLANISHELRTPLNGINGMLYLLTEEPLSDNQRHYLLLAEQSVNKLSSMIDNILSFTYISQKRHIIDETYIGIKLLLERIAGVIQLKNNNSLKISVNPPDAAVYTDETAVTLIVHQLLDNANKYSSDSETELNCSVEEGEMIISVCDHGIGIDEKEQENIFSTFYQSEDPYTKTYQGIGLGLSIVKSAVDMLGGTVSLESDVGKGTAVTVRLPIGKEGLESDAAGKASAVEQYEAAGELSEENNNAKILIVEDEAINRMYLERLLSEYDYSVIKAADGEEAVRLCFEENPDLIFMDIGLPKMNGANATKAIRASRIFKTTPIIALTAYTSPDDRARLLSAGLTKVIKKPIKKNIISDVIEQYLKKK